MAFSGLGSGFLLGSPRLGTRFTSSLGGFAQFRLAELDLNFAFDFLDVVFLVELFFLGQVPQIFVVLVLFHSPNVFLLFPE